VKTFGFLILLHSSLVGRCDTVSLTTGGMVEGTILEAESSPSKLVVLTRTGKHIIPRSTVESIQSRVENRVPTYSEMKAKLSDDAEGQYQLGNWCAKYQYRKESQEHYRRAIIHDPNHAGARAKLGYKKVGESWKTQDEINAEQGLVKDTHGKWVLPQQKEETERKAAQKKKRAEYFSRIRVLTRMMVSENAVRAEQAVEQLSAIRDPAAIEPLVRFLGDASLPGEHRSLLVKILAEMDDAESTKALIDLAISDPSSGIREEATQALVPRKSPALTKTIVGFLKNKENAKVNNAADVLGELGETSVVPDLVDALITKHTYTHRTTAEEAFAPPGARMEAFTPVQQPDGTIVLIPNSGSALLPGPMVQNSIPNKRVIRVTHQNPRVLTALTKLTNEDYGFDKKRWLDWLKANQIGKSARTMENG
jgi:hypothetical protein